MALDLRRQKGRIRDIISDAAIDGVRSVVVGRPYFDDIKRMTGLPRIFVSSSNNDIDSELRGTKDGARVSPLLHDISIDIIIIVQGKDGPEAEAELDRIGFEVREIMEANSTLSAGGENELVRIIYPARSFTPGELGSNKSAKVIQLRGRVDD